MPRSWWKPEQPKDRTRFYVRIAKTDGVPLAALSYYVAACRATEERPGCWTAKHLGRQIGLGHWRIRQLLKQAFEAKLLCSERTTRGFRVWPHPIFAQWLKIKSKHPPLKDVHGVGYYRLSSVDKYGYTGSVLFELLDPEPRPLGIRTDKEGRTYFDDELELKPEQQEITIRRACHLFPWMAKESVRRAFRKLVGEGWLACSDPPPPLYRRAGDGELDVWNERILERPDQRFWRVKSRWQDSGIQKHSAPSQNTVKNGPGPKTNRLRPKTNRPRPEANRLRPKTHTG